LAAREENYFSRGSFQSWTVTSSNSQQVPKKEVRQSYYYYSHFWIYDCRCEW
jgi:hypothetical protein